MGPFSILLVNFVNQRKKKARVLLFSKQFAKIVATAERAVHETKLLS